MTQTEALRLALEALENLGNHDHVCPQWPTYAEPENYPKCNCGYDQAITAIKAALEAKDEPVALKMDVIVVNLVREGINKHRARELAEHFIKHTTTPPQQEAKDEPVVWNKGVPAMLPKQKEDETFIVSYEPKPEAKDEPVGTVKELFTQAAWERLDLKGSTEVYTTPPQRTWVGLTDKDWNRSKHNQDFQKGVDWAEEMLKGKNT